MQPIRGGEPSSVKLFDNIKKSINTLQKDKTRADQTKELDTITQSISDLMKYDMSESVRDSLGGLATQIRVTLRHTSDMLNKDQIQSIVNYWEDTEKNLKDKFFIDRFVKAEVVVVEDAMQVEELKSYGDALQSFKYLSEEKNDIQRQNEFLTKTLDVITDLLEDMPILENKDKFLDQARFLLTMLEFNPDIKLDKATQKELIQFGTTLSMIENR